VNFWIAGEVRRQGAPAPVFKVEIGQRFSLQPEFAVVGGKDQHAAGRQQSQGLPQQFNMIALDLEALGQLPGIGEGGRIEKDQVVVIQRPRQPLPTIRPDQLVPGTVNPVQFQIALRPIQIGC